jgi:hypothetical protein
MMTNKMKSVINIETKVARLFFALGMLHMTFTGIQIERICGWISTEHQIYIGINPSPE